MAPTEVDICKAICSLIEKRWTACDQDICILAVFLNPFVRADLFPKSNIDFNPASIFTLVLRVWARLFQQTPESVPSGLRRATIDYYNRKEEFSDDRMHLKLAATESREKGQDIDVVDIWSQLDTGSFESGRNWLVKLAIRILSVVANSAGCERLFSTMGLIHTKTRNRLDLERVRKLVYLRGALQREQNLLGWSRPRLKRQIDAEGPSDANNLEAEAELHDSRLEEEILLEAGIQRLIDEATANVDDDPEAVGVRVRWYCLQHCHWALTAPPDILLPTTTPAMVDPSNFTLNCLVFGDDFSKFFSVGTSLASTITALILNIVSTYKICEDEELTGVKLVQCLLAEDQVSEVQPLSNKPTLARNKFVKDYWPDPSAIDCKLIHVLVYSSSRLRAVPATHQTPSVAEITDTFTQLAIAQERTRRKVLDGPSALAAALPKAFMKQQTKDDTPIYNGRPWDRTGKPIELYHPAFRVFLDKLNQADAPSGLDYISTENLLRDSQATYDNEDQRKITLKAHLSIVLRRDISDEKVTGCLADGVIKWRALGNALQAYYSILELKNEIGGAACDPSIQGAESYAKYWCQNEVSPIRKLSCCPSFIIAVAGPWMCILGGVYLTEIVVQPLTEMLWVADHPQKESRLRYLARVFAALRDAIDHLEAYYQPLVSSASLTHPLREDPARFFPDICRFQGKSGSETKFTYVGNLTRLVFKAQTEDCQYVVVKFVERYSAPAHELLACQDLAPKLLFDSADHLYAGYRMVVMEFIPGESLAEYSDVLVGSQLARDTLQLIRPSVELALEVLHGANFVFGDLRPPNIMVVKEQNGETKAKLIDFDWCASVGEGCYPVNLSKAIAWAEGMEWGGAMKQEHDKAMYDSMFP